MHVHHRWAQAMTLIQIAIALAAITLLTRSKRDGHRRNCGRGSVGRARRARARRTSSTECDRSPALYAPARSAIMAGRRNPGRSPIRAAPGILGRDGGTGRRSGLKIRRQQCHEGSSPSPGTTRIACPRWSATRSGFRLRAAARADRAGAGAGAHRQPAAARRRRRARRSRVRRPAAPRCPRRSAGVQRHARDQGAARARRSRPAARSSCCSSACGAATRRCSSSARAIRRSAGGVLLLADGVRATVVGSRRSVLPSCASTATPSLVDYLERHGDVPLPPYITRTADVADDARYQTVYARHAGRRRRADGGSAFRRRRCSPRSPPRASRCAYVTLHVGAGTFQPVQTDDLAAHRMHASGTAFPAATVAAIARRARRAAGASSPSARPACARSNPRPTATAACARAKPRRALFITPGYRFRVVDRLLTNFHLPKSTLLMLVSALRRARGHPRRLCARDRRALPLLQLRRRDAARAARRARTASRRRHRVRRRRSAQQCACSADRPAQKAGRAARNNYCPDRSASLDDGAAPSASTSFSCLRSTSHRTIPRRRAQRATPRRTDSPSADARRCAHDVGDEISACAPPRARRARALAARARHGRDAGVHAGRHLRHGQGDGAERARRDRRADRPRQHLPPVAAPGPRRDRRASAACTASWAGTRPILTDSGGFQVWSLGRAAQDERGRRDVRVAGQRRPAAS